MDNQIIVGMRNRNVRLENEGKFWTEEDRQKLKDSYDSGIGITEIAYTQGRSETAVFQQIDKMGLFSSPIKRSSGAKEPKCLCANCKVCKNLCPGISTCPRQKEVV